MTNQLVQIAWIARLALAVVLVMGVLAAAWVGWQASANQRLHDGRVLRPRVVVGADGIASYVRRRLLDIDVERRPYPSPMLVGTFALAPCVAEPSRGPRAILLPAFIASNCRPSCSPSRAPSSSAMPCRQA